MTVSEHIGWLKMYVEGMTPDNWIDMRLRCERQLNELTAALSDQVVVPKPCSLATLRQAIIDNTRGDLFWIGEILLNELEKETGFKGSTAPPPSSTAGEVG